MAIIELFTVRPFMTLNDYAQEARFHHRIRCLGIQPDDLGHDRSHPAVMAFPEGVAHPKVVYTLRVADGLAVSMTHNVPWAHGDDDFMIAPTAWQPHVPRLGPILDQKDAYAAMVPSKTRGPSVEGGVQARWQT